MRLHHLTTALIATAFLAAAGAPALAAGPDDHKPKPGPSEQAKPGKPDQAKPGKPGQPDQAKPGKPGPKQAAPGKRDRYWKPEYKGGYVAHDRVFGELRRHHYKRFDGNPFFRDGHYVVKTWRDGHVVFVEINPYTGEIIGEIRL